ncbi:hypothetical protein IJI69_02315 [Candidatus Saccharibacteria bacterium]|nr:hypothetical protein [Candidatus Saccharibacteria bacterium]
MAEQTTEKTTEKAKKSNKGLIIGGIIGAIVLIAAIIALVVINPFKKVDLTGNYELTALEVNGEDQTSTLDLMKAFGISATLEIENDKEGKLSIFGDEAKFTYDGKKFHFEKSDDDEEDTPTEADYTTKDDTITITYETSSDDGDGNIETGNEKLTFTKKKD